MMSSNKKQADENGEVLPENPKEKNNSTGKLSQSNSVARSTSESSTLPQRQVQSDRTSLETKKALIGVVIAIPTVAALILCQCNNILLSYVPLQPFFQFFLCFSQFSK